jgi:excisionase family DNA binding protein
MEDLTMTAVTEAPAIPILPEEKDRALAEESSRRLAPFASKAKRLRVRIEGSKQTITLPAGAVRLLAELLGHMARGNAVTLVPIHAELTTQQAADFLGVSRPFLVARLEAGDIPFRKIGAHRRVLFKDLVAYKKQMYGKRRAVLNELAALDQELGLE